MPRKIDAEILAQQVADPKFSDPYSIQPRPEHGYWKIPPEIFDPLNEAYQFDFDPCPNPRPAGFDGRTVQWGRSNWVNPPFWGGLAYWAKKAVAEHRNGNGSVFIAPVDRWIWYLVNAGAQVRSVGPHDWIHTQTGERQKSPRPSAVFILPRRPSALEAKWCPSAHEHSAGLCTCVHDEADKAEET